MTAALQQDVRHDTALYADSAIPSAFDRVVENVKSQANEIIGSSYIAPTSSPTPRAKKLRSTATVLSIIAISIAAFILLALAIAIPLCVLL